MDNIFKNFVAEVRAYKKNGNIIDVGYTVASADFINLASKSGTPANNAGKVSKLEADGKIHQDFLRGKTVQTMIAKQDITVGTPVGVSNALDGYVAKAFQSLNSGNLPSPTYTSKTVTCSRIETVWLSATTFVVVYNQSGSYSGGGLEFINVIAGTMDLNTFAITWGTFKNLSISAGSSTYSKVASICRMDTNKFVVVLQNSQNTYLIGFAGTVSGNTITLGSASNSSAIGGSATYTTCTALSTTAGVAMFYGSTSYRYLVSFDVSGTTITWGTPKSCGSTLLSDTEIRLCKVTASSFLWTVQNTGGVYVATISAGVITTGTLVTGLGTGGASVNQKYYRPEYLSDGYVLLVYTLDATTAYCRVISVSGTVPTLGTAVSVSLGTITIQRLVVKTSTTAIWLINNYLVSVTVSGTTVTSYPLLTTITGLESGNYDFLYCGTYYAIFPYVFGANANYIYEFIEGMASNFIGFAQSSVSNGANVDVVVKGIDENQSGLVSGEYYRVVAGALSRIEREASVANLRYSTDVVKALSPTKVII